MFKRLCAIKDVSPGDMKQFDLKEEEILAVNLTGKLHCLEGRCSHAGAPLAEGSLKTDILTCPWHCSQFKLPDGSVLRGPARKPLRVYRTEEKDGQLIVETKDSKGCDGVEE
jgi:nitrite reductase/ring-hydroxylating ferredoxin subunit